MRNILISLTFGAALLAIPSCRKFTDPGEPLTQLTSTTVFSSDATATAAQLAIYAQLEGNGFLYELSVATGLSGDEMINYSTLPDRIDLFSNNLRPENSTVGLLWNRSYEFIYKANAVLEGVKASNKVSDPVKKQLQGEALFTRAFCHFYLCQLFGDIPVITSTDYRQNASATRQPASLVYQQIETDLLQSIQLLSANYVNAVNASTTERTRPNRFAATALLARVYLFQEKWAAAELTATSVLNLTSTYSLRPDVNQVFLKNSTEAIWQLQATVAGFNTYAGALFPFTALPSNVSLTPLLLNSFETGDLRLSAWTKRVMVNGTNYFFAYKYKAGQNAASITEYTMVLRLAELYLIRAEARARQSQFAGATADLNVLRSRANLPLVNLSNLPSVLDEVERQRRCELFAEAGDRWIDLRRTGRLHPLMAMAKGTNWVITDQLYPIPQVEINRNNLLVQNPGY